MYARKNLTLSNSFRVSRFMMMLLIACSLTGTIACKSTKKAAQAKAEQEARLAKEREEKERKEREETERLKKAEEAKKAPYNKLENVFNQIVSAGNVEAANKSIQDALTMFSSPEAPLLIIISKSGDNKDYDKPTTIKKYLEYLKDQKKNLNGIENLVFDESGKIKEVELRKK